MHACLYDHEFKHEKIAAVYVAMCVCVWVLQMCCSKRAIWFEVTLQMKLYHPEKGCEVDCVKSVCSDQAVAQLQICFHALNESCPTCLFV